MSWFPDMGTVTMIDAGEHVRAVGWLSTAHPFPQGATPAGFVNRLNGYAGEWVDSTEALGWGIFMGLHKCELCGRFRAYGNFGVPRGDLLFVAPEMVLHYVEVHHYRPPGEFILAVMDSPLPGTSQYRAAVEPFRQLQEECRERQRQEQIEHAARWAFDRGGSQLSSGSEKQPAGAE